MATIARQTTWSSGDTLTAAALNAEFNNIVNDYNGGITNANIASGAAIALSKLASTPATLTGSETLTNKTLTSPVLNGTLTGTAFLDEDTMASDSAIATASQQSIKAYVDSSVVSQADEDDAAGAITSSSTFANITGADVSITTTVTSHIFVIATVQAYQNAGSAKSYGVQLHNGSGLIGVEVRTDLETGNNRQGPTVFAIEQNKAAGTYTYTVQHRSQDNSTSITAEVVNFVCFSIPT